VDSRKCRVIGPLAQTCLVAAVEALGDQASSPCAFTDSMSTGKVASSGGVSDWLAELRENPRRAISGSCITSRPAKTGNAPNSPRSSAVVECIAEALVAQLRKEAEAHGVDVVTWLMRDRRTDE